MVSTCDVRSSVAEYLRGQADWRGRKAELHPYDTRNARSQAALLQVAAYVDGLPSDDATLTRLAASPTFAEGVYSPPIDELGQSQSGMEASRCGFNEPLKSADNWFCSWAETVISEAQEADGMLQEA